MSSKSDDQPVPFTNADAKKLADIHVSLIGNSALGTRGLVHRVESVEAKVDSHDRKFWLATVVGSGVWASLVVFKEYIFGGPK